MSDTLTVIVPAVPVRALSPNASRKQHWGTAHREREALRAATHLATRNTLNAQIGHDDAEWTYTGVTQGRDPEGLGRTIFTIQGQ
jgi:hypothetical protein